MRPRRRASRSRAIMRPARWPCSSELLVFVVTAQFCFPCVKLSLNSFREEAIALVAGLVVFAVYNPLAVWVHRVILFQAGRPEGKVVELVLRFEESADSGYQAQVYGNSPYPKVILCTATPRGSRKLKSSSCHRYSFAAVLALYQDVAKRWDPILAKQRPALLSRAALKGPSGAIIAVLEPPSGRHFLFIVGRRRLLRRGGDPSRIREFVAGLHYPQSRPRGADRLRRDPFAPPIL